ncbi:MAG: DUF4340 domain-containing protein [Phycisphaerae bacterium]|nr:DUF4340 domain-containing protein [Phycisphaerae bacterium]NUQ45500.1 DUF4340 domain-containing protein [Phycisphaerae bacterium]
MNQKTPILMLVAVLLVAVGVYFAQSTPEKSPSGATSGPQSLFDPKPAEADVVRLEMARSDKPTMVFEKSREEWRIVEPITGAADKFRVESEASRILNLLYVRAYAKDAADRPGEDTTRLGQPSWVVKLKDKNDKALTVRIGGPVLMANETYVQIEGDDRIYKVRGNLNSEMRAVLDDFRDKRLADFSVADIMRLSMSGLRTATLSKAEGRWTVEAPIRARADISEVNNLMSAITNARVTRFVEEGPKNLRGYGLEPPRLTLTLEAEIRKARPTPPEATQPAKPEFDITHRTRVIHFGAEVEGKVYGMFGGEGTPVVFQIPEATLTSLSPDLTKLRDKKVIAADPLRATKARVRGPGGSALLEKQDGHWVIVEPVFDSLSGQNKAEFAAVDDLLKGVRDLKATAFAEPSAEVAEDYGFGPGATSIELWTPDSVESALLTIGGPTRGGTGVYVRNEREQFVAVVKSDAVVALSPAPLAFVDRKLLQFDRGLANRIEIEMEGTSRAVSKIGETWMMTEPVTAPSETKAVTDLLADLASLDARTIAGSPADLARFGLDRPFVKCSVTIQPPPKPKPAATQPAATQPAGSGGENGESPATQPAAGDVAATADGSAPTAAEEAPEPPVIHRLIAARHEGMAYVFVEGGSKIGEVDDKIFRDLTAELHEHRVVKFDTSQLAAIELRYPDRTLVFEKSGNDWLLEGEPGFRGDAGKLRQIADGVRDLQTTRFVSYQATDPAAYKLDAPAIAVTIRPEEGLGVELRISSEGPANDEEQRRYATIVGTNKVFLVYGSDAAKFDKQIKDMERSDAPPPQPAGSPFGASFDD